MNLRIPAWVKYFRAFRLNIIFPGQPGKFRRAYCLVDVCAHVVTDLEFVEDLWVKFIVSQYKKEKNIKKERRIIKKEKTHLDTLSILY